jgi:hypothetical protein
MRDAISPVAYNPYLPPLQAPQFAGPTLPLQGAPLFPPVKAIGSGNIGPGNARFNGFDPSQFDQLGVSFLTPQLGSSFQMQASQNARSAGGFLNVWG